MRSGSFSPGRLSTPEETSTTAAPVSADRLGDVVRASGRRRACRACASSIPSERAPVERRAVAAGARAVGRRTGVEQDEVGGAAIVARAARASAAVSTLTAFMTGLPQRRWISADALRRLVAVQLQDVGLDGGHYGRR